MSDLIDRQAAIDAADRTDYTGLAVEDVKKVTDQVVKELKQLSSAQPTEVSCWGCNCTKMERLKEQKTFSEMVHLHDAERREE